MTRALGMRVFATLVVWAVAVLMPSPAAAIKNGQAITKAPGWAAYVTTVSRFLFTQTSETSCTGTGRGGAGADAVDRVVGVGGGDPDDPSGEAGSPCVGEGLEDRG
jgi:hypothetical protein